VRPGLNVVCRRETGRRSDKGLGEVFRERTREAKMAVSRDAPSVPFLARSRASWASVAAARVRRSGSKPGAPALQPPGSAFRGWSTTADGTGLAETHLEGDSASLRVGRHDGTTSLADVVGRLLAEQGGEASLSVASLWLRCRCQQRRRATEPRSDRHKQRTLDSPRSIQIGRTALPYPAALLCFCRCSDPTVDSIPDALYTSCPPQPA
jgi:hypothetical protein